MKFQHKKFKEDLLKHRGFTSLRALSKKVKVSPATLSRVERGKLLDLETYAKLCKWMGVSLDTYFTSGKKFKSGGLLTPPVTAREYGSSN